MMNVSTHSGPLGGQVFRESREASLARSLRSSFAKQKCDASVAGCWSVPFFNWTPLALSVPFMAVLLTWLTTELPLVTLLFTMHSQPLFRQAQKVRADSATL